MTKVKILDVIAAAKNGGFDAINNTIRVKGKVHKLEDIEMSDASKTAGYYGGHFDKLAISKDGSDVFLAIKEIIKESEDFRIENDKLIANKDGFVKISVQYDYNMPTNKVQQGIVVDRGLQTEGSAKEWVLGKQNNTRSVFYLPITQGQTIEGIVANVDDTMDGQISKMHVEAKYL